MLSILLFATYAAARASVVQQKDQYWAEDGLANPSRRLLHSADGSMMYFNTTSEVRTVLLCTIATPASFPAVLPRVLDNLARLESQNQLNALGNPTDLAKHTIVSTTNKDAQEKCMRLAEIFRQVRENGGKFGVCSVLPGLALIIEGGDVISKESTS